MFQWVALGIVLLTVVTRLPSLLHPQPIFNEAIYSVVANEIVDGGRPYVDAVERKPPLLFWTYAAIFEVAADDNLEGPTRGPAVLGLGAEAGRCSARAGLVRDRTRAITLRCPRA